MKTKKLSLLVLCLFVGLMTLISGCKKVEPEVEPEPQTDPELKPELTIQQDSISVQKEGGIFTIAYTLKNAPEGAAPKAVCTQDWITEIKVDAKKSEVSFQVLKNKVAEERHGQIELSYAGIEKNAVIRILQEVGVPDPFKITIKDVQKASATADIIPLDAEMYYYIMVRSANDMKVNELTTDEAIHKYFIEDVNKEVKIYGYTFEQVLANRLIKGKAENVEIKNLNPGKDYVMSVFGIDPKDGGKLISSVVQAEFKTVPVEKIDAKIDITVNVSANMVETILDPGSYKGAYYYGIVTKEDLDKYGAQDMAESMWDQMLQLGRDLDLPPKSIIESVCNFGVYRQASTFDPEKAFAVIAYAINDEALICTDPFVKEFKTGAIGKSDNVLTISLTEIKGRSACLNIKTTNIDPYVAGIIDSDELAGLKSDQEILEFLKSNFRFSMLSGDFSSVVEGLAPESKYTAFAFGLNTDIITTGLTKVEFTTTTAPVGKATCTVEWSKYYDTKAVAAIDAKYKRYTKNDALLPMTLVTNPENATVFYYGLLSVEAFKSANLEMNEKNVFKHLKKQRRKTNTYTADYNKEYVFAAMVEDQDGNLSKLWLSEKFTLKAEGAANPQEFIDSMKAPARMTMEFLEAENEIRILDNVMYPLTLKK